MGGQVVTVPYDNGSDPYWDCRLRKKKRITTPQKNKYRELTPEEQSNIKAQKGESLKRLAYLYRTSVNQIKKVLLDTSSLM